MNPLTAPSSSNQCNIAKDARNTVDQIIPGMKMYSKANISTTLILSDSTLNRIPNKQLKENLDQKYENVIRKIYPGNTAKEISHNSILPLNEIRPEQVIIVAGTNDLSRGYQN